MQEHEDILEALKARDGGQLSTLLRELSENSLRREKHCSMAAAREVTSLKGFLAVPAISGWRQRPTADPKGRCDRAAWRYNVQADARDKSLPERNKARRAPWVRQAHP